MRWHPTHNGSAHAAETSATAPSTAVVQAGLQLEQCTGTELIFHPSLCNVLQNMSIKMWTCGNAMSTVNTPINE